MTQETKKRVVTAEELAQALGVSTRTIWRALREGRIKALRVGPRLPRFDLEEVLDALRGEPRQSSKGDNV